VIDFGYVLSSSRTGRQMAASPASLACDRSGRTDLAERTITDVTLPTFRNPPVVEVALAVQWEAPRLDALQVAEFGQRVRERYPLREEQIARPPMQEEFGVPQRPLPFQLEVLDRPPSQRFWFLTSDGSHLIQLQTDLVAVNWRRTAEGADYPRYPALREEAFGALEHIQAILKEEGAEPLKPNWCEVNYTNHIGPLPGESDRPPLHRVLASVAPPPKSTALPLPEDRQLIERFVIGEDDERVGRVHVGAIPAYRTEDRTPIYVLTLTARLRPRPPDQEGTFLALDRGRELLDHAFVEMTTSDMHTLWDLDDNA
jgi:uncharacterized protein (TIGR04255 family)